MPCHIWSQTWRLLGPDRERGGCGRGWSTFRKPLLHLQPVRPANSSSLVVQGPRTDAVCAHFSPLTWSIQFCDPPQLPPAPVSSPLHTPTTPTPETPPPAQRPLLQGALPHLPCSSLAGPSAFSQHLFPSSDEFVSDTVFIASALCLPGHFHFKGTDIFAQV